MTVTLKHKTDSEIKDDVLRELKWDTRISATEVGVEVDDGIVTLTGSVSTYTKKLTAEDAAHRVFGVQDVANEIEVVWPNGTIADTEIAKRIRNALEWELIFSDEDITSTVKSGWVTLRGTVDSFSHIEDAVKAVRKIKGVRGVTNEINVELTIAPTSTEVCDEIEEALDRQAMREANHIMVNVKDGEVNLTGTVRSWPERRAVVDAAKFTPGVSSVDALHLKVDPYASV